LTHFCIWTWSGSMVDSIYLVLAFHPVLNLWLVIGMHILFIVSIFSCAFSVHLSFCCCSLFSLSYLFLC
jgi:hypothetical protein